MACCYHFRGAISFFFFPLFPAAENSSPSPCKHYFCFTLLCRMGKHCWVQDLPGIYFTPPGVFQQPAIIKEITMDCDVTNYSRQQLFIAKSAALKL